MEGGGQIPLCTPPIKSKCAYRRYELGKLSGLTKPVSKHRDWYKNEYENQG